MNLQMLSSLKQSIRRLLKCCCILLLLAVAASLSAQQLVSHALLLSSRKTIALSLPVGFTINVAAQGLHRPRFFARSPDNRIFVTEMYDLSDNQRGAIFILTSWNSQTHTFAGRTPYLTGLHNPNNLAFYTDPVTHQTWLYTALTDRLLRYRYSSGDNAPKAPPEVLAQFPAYGLNYKYGGWHLTRTVVFAELHGHTQLYVAVGSSCNACLEKEEVRASLLRMDPDGKNSQIVVRGLRNAVDLQFVPRLDGGSLFATNMGDDHLGDKNPEDSFLQLDANNHAAAPEQNYGWPTCYFDYGQATVDPYIATPDPKKPTLPPPPAGPAPAQFDCTKVPAPYTTFLAHSSPLGLAYFADASSRLDQSFLVALHGASHPRIGTGYRVVRFSLVSRHPQNFILGFLVDIAGKPVVQGRPCGIFQTAPDSFLLTDDLNGVIYSIQPDTSARAAVN